MAMQETLSGDWFVIDADGHNEVKKRKVPIYL